jgi:hypothetical protein
MTKEVTNKFSNRQSLHLLVEIAYFNYHEIARIKNKVKGDPYPAEKQVEF